MESLTQDKEKIFQMGTIKSKDQALAMGVLNAYKGKHKARNLKQSEKRKLESSQGEG